MNRKHGSNGRSVILVLLAVMLVLGGCGQAKQSKKEETAAPAPASEYTKYNDTFFDAFDTLVQVVGYTKTEAEFKQYFDQIHERFLQLHKEYDIYNDYDGLNNVKTINDAAGKHPVKVNADIMNLLLFSKEWYDKVGETNIAMGSVLRIWHDYREAGMDDPEHAKLPPMDELKAAAKHMDLSQLILDQENSSVFLKDPKMSLDVGAVAKGYATEVVAKELEAKGFNSFMISAGGNVRGVGKPLDGLRAHWGVGLQNPKKFLVDGADSLLDTVFINDASVVSSGDYQRYYMVDGKVYHHLIDPKTLMPGDYYHAVTVVTKDSGLADFLSTVVFLLPYEQSRALVEKLDGVEALWVMEDGKVEATAGLQKIMKSQGASGAN